MPIPKIMIVAPPKITRPKGYIAHKFEEAEKRCEGLNSELKKVSEELSVSYFDADSVTGASLVDGIHLDESQHKVLGIGIAKAVLNEKIF